MCIKSFCGHPGYVYSVSRYSGHCADCLASHSVCQIIISHCTMPSVAHCTVIGCSTCTALIILLSYRVEWGWVARRSVAVIKFQEVSLLLPAVSSWWLGPLQQLCWPSCNSATVCTSERNAVSDKPLGIMSDVGLKVNIGFCLNLLLCSVDSSGCVAFSALRISAYCVYVHRIWAVRSLCT